MEITEKLYYKDNRRIIFKAKIIEQYEDKNGWVVILDKTLFYPEGGGQPADRGWINEVKVNNVQKKNDIIMHYISKEIKTETVDGKIDWEHRFNYMQQHTGQHLISGAFWKVGKYKTVSVNMSIDYTTIEIETKSISDVELNKVEELANDMILENVPVNNIIINDNELSNYDLRRACLIKGDIRLVNLGDFDCVACGGIHLSFTGEVRLVKIIKTEKIRGNIRVYWKIGNRAFVDYSNKTRIVSKLKIALNSNEDDLDKKVDQLKNEIEDIKHSKKTLEKKIIEFYKEDLLRKFTGSVQHKESSADTTMPVLVASGDISAANAKNCAQFFSPGPQSFGRSSLPAGHAAEKVTSRLNWLGNDIESKVIIKKWINEDDQLVLNLVKSLIIEKNIILCMLNKTDKNIKWIIACSEDIDFNFNNIRDNLLKPFDCKGGGKHPIWQGVGNIKLDEEGFLNKFEKIVRKEKNTPGEIRTPNA